MKDAIKERLDWVSGSFAAQVFFFALGSILCLKELSHGNSGLSAQLFLSFSVLLLILTGANAIVSFGILRQFLGLLLVLVSCFLIPFSLNAYGLPLNYVVLCGMLYSMSVIAIAPKFAGVGTLIASAAFACYLHYDAVVFHKLPVYDKELASLERRLVSEGEAPLQEAGVKLFKVPKEMSLADLSALKDVYGDKTKWDFLYKANKSRLDGPGKSVQAGTVLIVAPLPKIIPMDFIKLGFWFLAGAIIAFCWRLLVGKMFELYKLAMSNSSKTAQRQVDDLNAQLDGAKRESHLLKEEVALQIIEMNRITGFKK